MQTYSVTPTTKLSSRWQEASRLLFRTGRTARYFTGKTGYSFLCSSYWGPGADIKSTKWIADASMLTDELYDPTLTLIYLPHLDYCLQKFGS